MIVMRLGYEHPTIYLTPWLHSESILVGIVLAFWYLDREPAWPWALAFAVAAVSFALMWKSGATIMVYGPGQYVIFATVALIMGGLLCAAVRGPMLFKQVLSARPLRFLGKVSYGLYVYHLLAIAVTTLWFDEGPLGFVAALSLTIAMASASYYVVERPF